MKVKCPARPFAGWDELRRTCGLEQRELCLELVRLRVKKAIPKPSLAPQPLRQPGSGDALLGTRPVAYGSAAGDANVYRWESLGPGDRVQGCSILEAASTTYFVPEGWALLIDPYGNAQIQREAGAPLEAARLQETRSHGQS